MEMVGNGHQGEEVVIYVAYFKILNVMGIERRYKGCALFHISVGIICSNSQSEPTATQTQFSLDAIIQ